MTLELTVSIGVNTESFPWASSISNPVAFVPLATHVRFIWELDIAVDVRLYGVPGGYTTVTLSCIELPALWALVAKIGSITPKKTRYQVAFLTLSLYHFTRTILKFFFHALNTT